jgi:hypothetical protein
LVDLNSPYDVSNTFDGMQVCPDWCGAYHNCWEDIVDKWLSEEAYAKHMERRECRLQMPGLPHHQGPQPLAQYAERWVYYLCYSFFNSNAQFSLLVIVFVFSSQSRSHENRECNEYLAYALAHRGKATAPDNVYDPAHGPEAYTNENAYTKLTEYTAAARERHGADFDPTAQPLDTDLVMRLGGGKQHGRYWMANSAISSSSVDNLATIRSRSTSSSVPIRPRQQSSAQMVAVFQVTSLSFVVHCFMYSIISFALFKPCVSDIAGSDESDAE